MSLTNFLEARENKDVRQVFKETFEKPKFKADLTDFVKPTCVHPGIVGTAFDYLLRFYLERLNPFVIVESSWVAEHGLGILENYSFRELSQTGRSIIKEAKKERCHYLETGKPTQRLFEIVLLLAQLDVVYRVSMKYLITYGYSLDKRDVGDLKNLFSLLKPEMFKTERICLLNPTFNASPLVGAADADLIIDDSLIDIKTSKNPLFYRRDFNQLLGYFILFRLGGVHRPPDKPIEDLEIEEIIQTLVINHIGIYYARYGEFFTFDINNVVNEQCYQPFHFSSFINWFERRAKRYTDSLRQHQMEGVTCPYCKQTMYSASREVGKIVCIYCKKEFFLEKRGGKKNDIKSY